jgi:hypothetical protein
MTLEERRNLSRHGGHDAIVIASQHENHIDMKIIVHNTDKMSLPSLSSVSEMVDESKA